MTLSELCDRYMDWLKVRKIGDRPTPPKLIREVRAMCRDLCDAMGTLSLGDFRKGGMARVKAWAEAHPTWGPGARDTVYKRIKAIFNWAANSDSNEDAQDFIPYSPIKKLNTGHKRVTSKPREAVLSVKQERAILAALSGSRSQAFRRAFIMLLGTGMRPEEFCNLTAVDVKRDEKGKLYFLVDHKNQHKPRWAGAKRPVRIFGKLLQGIVAEAVETHPTGPLFRNAWGLKWSKGSLLQCLRRVIERPECQVLGLNDYTVERGQRQYRYVVYTLRHSFGHRCLTGHYKNKRGHRLEMSYARVADFMGNSAAEVEKTYGHIARAAAAYAADIM